MEHFGVQEASTGVLDGIAERPRQPRATCIACGSSHSVALLDSQLVLAWGRGEDGQLGHGDAEERPLPQPVHSLTDAGITSVHCGAEYSMAVSSSRQEVYSWGWGDFGRLGHGDIIDVFIPKQISVLSGIGVTTVACGDTHTLALTASGQVYSFGRNQNGQLGRGDDKDCLYPVIIEALEKHIVVSIACGAEHSLASTDTGEVFAWGWGRYGNLGTGSKTDRLLPTPVTGLQGCGAVKVACGWRHSVVITKDGKLWTFGWNRYGQLGLGTHVDETLAVQVKALDGVVVRLISGGWRHSVAATADGHLYSWGWNKFGQLGIGSTNDSNLPARIEGLQEQDPVVQVSAGWRHNFAITREGVVYSWGRGCMGQLGHGTGRDLHVPTLMTDLTSSTLDQANISARGGPAAEGTSYIPFADRYAVVPDHGSQQAAGYTVPEISEPDIKRHCS